mgnify:FL=1|jgi:hypothetical protein|tara:strand:- start:706 stop:1083 length:378 start_codon:yes stop_codon:yes gene_type:complete
MKLYKLLASNYETYFGTSDNPITRDVTIIAQTPNYNAFLLLAKDAQTELELLTTVPSGFNLTYCQEWGLIINDAVVDRVILDLRKKAYGPWESQLEKIYDDGIDSWKADITAVKTKFPKKHNNGI